MRHRSPIVVELERIGELFQQAERKWNAQRDQVEHVHRKSTLGRPTSVLGPCEPDCAACRIDRRYREEREALSRRQYRVLLELGKQELSRRKNAGVQGAKVRHIHSGQRHTEEALKAVLEAQPELAPRKWVAAIALRMGSAAPDQSTIRRHLKEMGTP